MAAAAMEDLADRYASRGVTSVFVYTREAHPGENHGHHSSMDVKRKNARTFQGHSDLRRPILIDDLEGSAHHAYGLLPNMTWIMAPQGRILYKATWTSVEDVEEALVSALKTLNRRTEERLIPFHTERCAWRVRDHDAFRAGLERNGPQAVRDYYGS